MSKKNEWNLELVEYVKKTVKEKTGKSIDLEVEII